MKKIAILICFFSCFSLYSQNYRQTKIYVPPVTGEGKTGDSVYFYKQLTYELALQNYSVVKSIKESDYSIKGAVIPLKDFRYLGFDEDITIIMPEEPKTSPSSPTPPLRRGRGKIEFFSWDFENETVFYDSFEDERLEKFTVPRVMVDPEQPGEPIPGSENEYVLFLELASKTSTQAIARQYLVYESTGQAVDMLLAVVVYNMLSLIPDIEENYLWRDKYIFINANLLWAPRIYHREYQSVHWMNIGGKVVFEYAFLSFLSVDAGIQVIQDWVEVRTGEEYMDVILEVPVSIKYIFKPAEYLLLQPYGGVSLNLPLIKTTEPSMFSWFAGLQLGIKAGPGMAVIDPRVTMDFFNSKIVKDGLEYRRYMMQVGLGYKMGFIPRKSKSKQY